MIADDMLRGIEDGLWLTAWSDAMEEARRSLPRNITRMSADQAPRSVTTLAKRFASLLEKQNKTKLRGLWRRANEADKREVDPEELGYYLAMQGLGHGVRWDDNHEPFDVRIPGAEAHAWRSRGRWGFEGSVTDRYVTVMEAFRPRAPAEERLQQIISRAFEEGTPAAILVAADAAEEAGKLSRAEELRKYVDELLRRSPQRDTRSRRSSQKDR